MVRPGEDAEALRDAEDLTATILEAAAVDFLETLLERCPSGAPMRAEVVDAVDWKFVERSYRVGSGNGAMAAPTTRHDTETRS